MRLLRKLVALLLRAMAWGCATTALHFANMANEHVRIGKWLLAHANSCDKPNGYCPGVPLARRQL